MIEEALRGFYKRTCCHLHQGFPVSPCEKAWSEVNREAGYGKDSGFSTGLTLQWNHKLFHKDSFDQVPKPPPFCSRNRCRWHPSKCSNPKQSCCCSIQEHLVPGSLKIHSRPSNHWGYMVFLVISRPINGNWRTMMKCRSNRDLGKTWCTILHMAQFKF